MVQKKKKKDHREDFSSVKQLWQTLCLWDYHPGFNIINYIAFYTLRVREQA